MYNYFLYLLIKTKFKPKRKVKPYEGFYFKIYQYLCSNERISIPL